MSFLTEPFQFEFFVRALIAAVIVGVTCGAVGTHVTLRNMSAIGNGLSQCTLGGVAVAVVAGVHPLAGALAGIVGTIAVTWIETAHKELTLTAFDPDGARTIVRDPARTELIFQLSLAAVVVAAVQVVGVLLIAATLVLPAATARLRSRSATTMLRTSALVGGGIAVVGLFTSFHADIASGPAIVHAGTAAFAIAWASQHRVDIAH